ncbi:MAG: thiol:disulfide interchange protein DsbA/DsbL [Salinisphaeraceae bacterium]
MSRPALTLALAAGLLTATAANAQFPARYVAGEHYTALESAAPTQAEADQVAVIEFFVYGCSHCYEFDPMVTEWANELADDVTFRRVPATFGQAGPVYARVFYTAKALDLGQAFHEAFFDGIHQAGRRLVATDEIRAFFVEQGVAGETFDKTFNSEAIDERVANATRLMQAYGVTAVPSLGVAGRFWTNPRQTGGYEPMLNVADFLIDRARD